MRRFLAELRQRSVFKVALVYLVSAWVLMQVADVMFPALRLPEWAISLVAALLVMGFPLALILAWAFELTPDGIRREQPIDDGSSQLSQGKSKSLTGVSDPERSKSIAVLPFADLSANHDNEYFSDGLTEELLNVLAKIDHLRVSSRTSCFAFKAKNADIATAAKQLRADHILEGSVRKAGDQVRVTVQLIEVASDSRLWSERYDRELNDIFVIQDDIAHKIAEALRLELGPQGLHPQTTENAKAYDYYLRGRSFFNKFGPKSLGFAIEMFKQATSIDPRFARAWSGLADAHAVRAIYYGDEDTDAEAAGRASEESVRLAPDLAETHTSRGIAHLAGEHYEEAARAFERAIELDPDMWEPYYFYARTMIHWGRMQDALAYFDKAAQINPDDYQGPLIAASLYRGMGEVNKALEAEQRGVRLAERHLEDYPDTARAYYLATAALYNLGKKEKAFEWTDRAIAIDPHDPATMYNVACFYAQAGEADRAFECLENSVRSLAWLENDPELDPIRDDPRFRALLAKLKSKTKVQPVKTSG